MLLGIDIGGTKCAVIKGDKGGKIIDKIKFKTTGFEETLENILKAAGEMGKADAIGISCGGPLNSKKGIIMSPPNLPGWDIVEIVKIFEDRFGTPTAVQNDANACALAEWKFGAGRGSENMIFLTFGTGLGAGLILNGALYSGTCDLAGEVGHIRLAPFGPVGFGKCGSFEGFCSGGGIAELGKAIARREIQSGRKTAFCESLDGLDGITAEKIANCAKSGDKAAIEVYEISGEKLGEGLSFLIDILNPEKIVIGSVFARSGELLREKMQQVINREAIEYSKNVCQIVAAELGDSIGDYAALAVAEDLLYKIKGGNIK